MAADPKTVTVSGVPPKVHDIAANYFLDRATGEEVMMNDPKFRRVGATEQRVPLIVTRPLQGLAKGRCFRNFDAFDLAMNHAQ